jgi:hypothetical protein
MAHADDRCCEMGPVSCQDILGADLSDFLHPTARPLTGDANGARLERLPLRVRNDL